MLKLPLFVTQLPINQFVKKEQAIFAALYIYSSLLRLIVCMYLNQEAEEDLQAVLPDLDRAEHGLRNLDKKHFDEIRYNAYYFMAYTF